jgi:hypothetical protein
MTTTPRKAALAALLAILLLSGFAAQEPPPADRYPTGLIPLTPEQLETILDTWPRVVRVGFNWLGFERVNAVRVRAGQEPLGPDAVRPVGREVESARGARRLAVQTLAAEPERLGDLPVSVDNSKLPYFPPIRSQGQLGSCTAFATTYTQLSYMTAFQRGLDIRDNGDNTNKYSPKWTYNMVNDGLNSGSSFSEIFPLLEKHGACTWAEFPYDNDFRFWCLDPAAWRNALDVKTDPSTYVWPASTETGLGQIKELLVNGYVLTFGTYISSWVYKLISDDPSTLDDDAEAGKRIAYWLNGSEGGHAMTVVGYNDAVWTDVNGNGLVDPGEKGAFRIANSWGAAWEESGFVWLAYDALKSVSAVDGGPSQGRIRAFQGDIAHVLTVRDGYAPLMIAEFTVNHLKRDQLKMTLGRSDTSAEVPSVVWTPGAVKNSGGPYAFDGSTTAVDGTFVFDLSDLLVEGGAFLRYYVGMSDNAAGDPATLKAFKIVDLTTAPPTELASSLVPRTADGGQPVYSYVDYAYSGPLPGYNRLPRLSNPQVQPASGSISDTFTYYVRYYDGDGDVPAVKDVWIDGAARPMSFLSSGGGSASDGWYYYQTSLSAGTHDYYFLFEDGRGGSARTPTSGELSGPDVFALLVTSLQPSSATAGGPAFVLTVEGSYFEDGAVVRWDGSDRPTAFVSSSRLEAQIAAADIDRGRYVEVTVRNPDGEISNPRTFTINNPHPALSSISPDRATGGGPDFTLTLLGSNFVPGSTVRWGAVEKAATFVSGTELRALIASGDLSTAGDISVSVFNPAPGGGESSAAVLTVAGVALSSSPESATVSAGQSVAYDITITPQHGTFDSPVSFSCERLPRACTAVFTPASATPGASSVKTVLALSTKSRAGAAMGGLSASSARIPPAWGLLLLLPALVLALRAGRPGRPGLARRYLAAAALVCALALAGGCGAGGTGTDSPGQGTPAGTYEITVKATSGSLTASTTVTLVVL